MMTVEQLTDILYEIAEGHEKSIIGSREKSAKEVQDQLEKEIDHHDVVSYAADTASMMTIIEVLNKLGVPESFRNREFEQRIERWDEIIPDE